MTLMLTTKHKVEIENTLKTWRNDPVEFVKAVYKAEPEPQQIEFLRELQKMVLAKRKVKDKQPVTPEEERYARKIGISIMSGKGIGKTTALVWAASWFLLLYKNSKIPVTGPSYDQIRDVFMSEFNKWNNHAKSPTRPHFDIQTDNVRIKVNSEPVKNWFLKLRTANKNASVEQQADTLAGWHEDYLMVVADEASGIPDPVFSKFDSTITKPVNFVIMAFNPNRTTGFAYDSQFNDAADIWIKLHWSALDSKQVTPQAIENIKAKYGENSNEYRISVLGLPPLVEQDSLIPYDWLMAAVERYPESTPNPKDPRVLGIDVAREGVDKTSAIIKHGRKIIAVKRYNEVDSIEAADRIALLHQESNIDATAIDSIGLGGPVYDYLKRKIQPIKPVDVHRKASNPERFCLLRDELWWMLRELFREGLIDIPYDRDLISELSNIKYTSDERGRIKVESKKQIKGRGLASPDSADAIVVTLALKNILTKAQDSDYKESVVKKPHRKYGWMGV